MATWNSRGLRGSTLEELINYTNEAYRKKGLALIQKIPTPIKPVEMDKNRHITLAYFEQKSTVDYIGAVQGIPICFDAKECNVRTFPLQNVHEHQVAFMREFEQQGGIAFLLISYTALNEMYYLPFRDLERFWTRAAERASPMTRSTKPIGSQAGQEDRSRISSRSRKIWNFGTAIPKTD